MLSDFKSESTLALSNFGLLHSHCHFSLIPTPTLPSMTRARKLTLSMKEFSHLVSESLDIANPSTFPQSLVDNAVFSETPQKTHPRPSSFQRIFSRPIPTHGQHEDSRQCPPENLSETPRKMIGWPFSRSPRKNRPTKDEVNATVRTPTCHVCLFVHSNLAGYQRPWCLSPHIPVLGYVTCWRFNVEPWFFTPRP